MRKEDKSAVIGQLTETLKEFSNFYLTDIEALNAEKTSTLRRECFKQEVKLVVVKNTLLKKALENQEGDFTPLYDSLKGNTAIMFSNVANVPARLIKDFTKDTKGEGKSQLKAAYVQESFYVGKYQEQERTYCRCYCIVGISGKERYFCSYFIRTNYSRSIENSGRKIILITQINKSFKLYKNGRFESYC